jgi:hypothetical protein
MLTYMYLKTKSLAEVHSLRSVDHWYALSYLTEQKQSLTVADENTRTSIESRILRKLFRPVQGRGDWRIRIHELSFRFIPSKSLAAEKTRFAFPAFNYFIFYPQGGVQIGGHGSSKQTWR